MKAGSEEFTHVGKALAMQAVSHPPQWMG